MTGQEVLLSRAGPAPYSEVNFLSRPQFRWAVTTSRQYLGEGEIESKLAVIRQRTHTGRPLGTAEFMQDLEKATQRQ